MKNILKIIILFISFQSNIIKSLDLELMYNHPKFDYEYVLLKNNMGYIKFYKKNSKICAYHIQELYINPKFRNKNLARHILSSTINLLINYYGAAEIWLLPYPFEQIYYGTLTYEERILRLNKLIKFYTEMGFETVENSPEMVYRPKLISKL